MVRLAQRMLGGQRRQLRDDPLPPASAEGEFGIVAPLQQEQPGLGQALGEGVAAQFGGEAAERGAAPQGEGGGALAHDPFPVAGGVRTARGGDVAVVEVDVQFALGEAELVAGRDGTQPLGVVEEAAQPGHVVVQRGARGGGRRAAPQDLPERLDGDDPAGVEEQGGEQGAHLGAADGLVRCVGVLGVVRIRGGGVQHRWAQQSEAQLAVASPCHPVPRLPARPCRVTSEDMVNRWSYVSDSLVRSDVITSLNPARRYARADALLGGVSPPWPGSEARAGPGRRR